MKKTFFIILSLLTLSLSFAQDDSKSELLLDLLEFKLLWELLDVPPNPPYITQVTKYSLSGLGSAGIRTNIEVHKYVYDGEETYLMQLLQNSFGAYDACYISYEGISKVQDALQTLKKELEAMSESESNFYSNSISRGGVFRVGYYFVKETPKWYIVVGDSGFRTSIEGTYWLEEALQEAKDKIESLMQK